MTGAPNEPSIYDLIRTSHRVASTLLEELTDTGAEEGERRRRLLAAVREELALHALTEEAVFDGLLRQSGATRALVAQARQEHEVILRLLGAQGRGPAGERRDDAMTELSAHVARHIEAEERELFPAMVEALDEDQARALAVTYQAERARIEGERRAAALRRSVGPTGAARSVGVHRAAQVFDDRRRLDEHIIADIRGRLEEHPELPAEDIEVHVVVGEVTLAGAVEDRAVKYIVEELVEAIPGVTDVYNLLTVREDRPEGRSPDERRIDRPPGT